MTRVRAARVVVAKFRFRIEAILWVLKGEKGPVPNRGEQPEE
jgi:hypothetical protein